MSSNRSDNEGAGFVNKRRGIGEINLASVIVEGDHGEPARCTVYDPKSGGVDRMSAWITAKGTAFVDCREYR